MSNRATAFTADSLLQILQSLPAVNAYVVGFSGGADSTALLHAMYAIEDQLDLPLSAVHVNHGLHDDADLWQRQCEDFCDQHNIDLVCLRVNLQHDSGKGLEAEARQLRYEAISALLKPGNCLVTAHHADDQAETLILNLMRGSGVDGLSAMPESRPLGPGVLQRPLLRFQSSALRGYLCENGIEWSEDPSNQHLNHDRNFVRHEILPLLEKRWPEVSKRLLLTRQAMTDARRLLERLAGDYVGANLAHRDVLKITAQLLNEAELFRLVIRYWVKQAGTSSIPVYRLESFYQQVRQADDDQNITLAWGNWFLHLYKQHIWLRTNKDITPCPAVNWPAGCNTIDLGGDAGQLCLGKGDGPGPDSEFSVGGRSNLPDTTLRQGVHHKSLKNLFQMADIPPWLRDAVPLCKLGGELVAMGDWCVSEQFSAWLSEHKLTLSWHPRHPLLKFIVSQQNPQIVDPAGAVR